LALLITVLVFAGACFWILSPWQFGRNAEQQQQNDQISAALHTPAVPLEKLLPEPSADPAAVNWREVIVTGHYLPQKETLARLRVVDGKPASVVLTPFQPAHGPIMLIDRGYVVQDNGQTGTVRPAPAGTVTLKARVHPDEQSSRGDQTLTSDGHQQVYAVSSKIVTAVTGTPLRQGTFALTNGQPGALSIESLPQLDSGPFLSYALQWIVFGVMALGGLGYFTWRELQPGGALTQEARARRRNDTARAAGAPVRGRKAVAAAIAEDEARESVRSP
jgi:cytochrome oxidase assembly protein ShyY1